MTDLATRILAAWQPLVAVAAFGVVTVADSWRTAVLAALAAAAVVAARARFSRHAALALVVLAALAVLVGGGFADDERERRPPRAHTSVGG